MIVRVLLWHRGDVAGITEAYHAASRELAGTPGLRGNELLQVVGDPDCLLVASEWESRDAFEQWERGVRHKGQTAPLRPFRDQRDRPYEVLRVVASY
jgi:heme-degrading monooxygenase HmoA